MPEINELKAALESMRRDFNDLDAKVTSLDAKSILFATN